MARKPTGGIFVKRIISVILFGDILDITIILVAIKIANLYNTNDAVLICLAIVAFFIVFALEVELYKLRNLEKQDECKYCHYHDSKGKVIGAKSNILMTVNARMQKGKTNGIPTNKIVFSETKGIVFNSLDKNAKGNDKLSFDVAYCPMCGRKLSRWDQVKQE